MLGQPLAPNGFGKPNLSAQSVASESSPWWFGARFTDAWNSGEVSTNAGGLVRWPVKLVLPIGFGLVALQGVSEIIKCIAAFTVPGYKREHAYEKPLQ